MLTTVDNDPDVLKVAVQDDNAEVINHGAVSVTTTATLVRDASASRVTLLVQNLGADDVYVGGAAVTSTNGIKIPAAGSLSDLRARSALYAITVAGTCDVRWFEEAL